VGADRTALAVKRYDIGDRVLVTRLTAQEFEHPLEATVINPAPRSRIYGYQICLDDSKRYVKDDWLIPADIQIEEVSDTPWE
jgi:hypothetical protein